MKRPSELKLMRRKLQKENDKRFLTLTPVSKENWPYNDDINRIAVFLSLYYLAQIFDEKNGVIRISCNRTTMDQNGQWEENLSWDELMEVKRQCGYGESYAVEVLPGDSEIVNVANMRHIWITPHPIVGWRKK
ncbi:MAG: hypothetical protein ABSE05_16705 [Syntrophales bacterium]|jgi:hypothetical protein